MTRADGYKMVGGIVQGARTFDSTSDQWLTPDAYAGNVHDPMSQKPFAWMNTRGLYGASFREECVAAVQQVLKDAGLSQMETSSGAVIVNVPIFVNALQVSGYSQVGASATHAGDIVDLSGGHVGICLTAGCTSMISNSSTPGTFSWTDSPANENEYEGNGAITYYAHDPPDTRLVLVLFVSSQRDCEASSCY